MNSSQPLASTRRRMPHKEEPDFNYEADIPSDGVDDDMAATTVKVDNPETVPAR